SAPTSSPSTTLGSRMRVTIAAWRSSSPESTSSPGTRSSTSSTTAPGGSRTGPSHRPAIAASSTAATPLTSHRQRRRAGEGWVTSLRPAHRIGDLPQQVDHARSPPGVDVRAELDNPPGPHRGQLGPALPGGDRLDALAVLRVGEEDEVRVGVHDELRRQLHADLRRVVG